MKMLLKLDLHVHTSHSPDSSTDRDIIAQVVKSRGLDGIAVTEHDIASSFKSDEILVVPGIEVSSRNGHILALGPCKTVPKGLSAEETIELLRAQGCVIVIPHPYDRSCPSIDPLHLGASVDAIETVNSSSIPFESNKRKAENAAKVLGVSMVAGSDSHIPSTIGDAYTLVEATSSSVVGVLDAIRTGRTTPYGSPTNMKNRILSFKTSFTRHCRVFNSKISS